MLTYIVMLYCTGVVIEGPSNVMYHPGMTPLPIEITCKVSLGTIKLWMINSSTSYWLYIQLFEGRLPGHRLLTTDNILISSPVNNTKYTCVSYAYQDEIEYFSYPAYVIIAGKL